MYISWYWFVKYNTNIWIPEAFCKQTNSEMVWEIYTPILYNSERTCYECVYLWYIQYFICIKKIMHVVRSWISCRISSIASITISVTTIENLCIYYAFMCCIGLITVYTGIRGVALAALSSLAALGVVTRTPPDASAKAGLSSRRPSISVLYFCVYFDRASHFITSNCITKLMIFMCAYAYMYVLYVIPSTTFLLCT